MHSFKQLQQDTIDSNQASLQSLIAEQRTEYHSGSRKTKTINCLNKYSSLYFIFLNEIK